MIVNFEDTVTMMIKVFSFSTDLFPFKFICVTIVIFKAFEIIFKNYSLIYEKNGLFIIFMINQKFYWNRIFLNPKQLKGLIKLAINNR